jgi:UDP-glucuronate decarboxylase
MGPSKKSSKECILVAGGAGFIGFHLSKRLVQAGYDVVCLDNLRTGTRENVDELSRHYPVEFLEHDVAEPLRWRTPLRAVFNLACPASPRHYQADPVHTMMTCVNGTRHLLELAERHGATFVQASTSEVYGDPERHPQREDYWGNVNPTGPRACYDEGKRAAETLCFDFLRLGRADARVARIFNTYGPRMQADDGRIVSNLIVQALTGHPLTVYGSGEQTRSFCYVDDLVRGLVALMERDAAPERPVNLGNPGEFTVNELAALVLELTGSSSGVVHGPLPTDDPRRRRPDIGYAREVLDWEPTVPLVEGLAPTILWFRERLAAARRRRLDAPAGRRLGASETQASL